MSLRRFVLIIGFCLVGAVGLESQKNFTWKHYTSREGLSQNTVMDILQDRNGYLWFATWDGLSRFNGYRFTNFKVRPGDNVDISSSRIDEISVDKYGYLWLLRYGDSVCRFDPDREVFENVGNDNAGNLNKVQDIFNLKSGPTWLIGEGEGALRITTDSVSGNISTQKFSVKDGQLSSDDINKVFQDNNFNEWLLTKNGLSLLRDEKAGKCDNYFFETGENENSFQQSFFCAIDVGNEILFGAGGARIWRYEKSTGRFRFFELPSGSGIIALHQFRDGAFFAATNDDGFFVFKNYGEDVVHFHKNSSNLRSNKIYSTYKDQKENIWFQQNLHGVSHYSKSKNRIINHSSDTSIADGVDSPRFMIHEDVNGTLWIHPRGGGLSYFNYETNELKSLLKENDYDFPVSDRLHSMYSDSQGNLWMSTRAKGLEKFVFSKSEFRFLQPEKGSQLLNDNHVRAVMEDNYGFFWVATKARKLAIYDDQRRFLGYIGPDGELHPDAHFSFANVYSIIERDNGEIWLGTKGEGLIRAIRRGNPEDLRFSLEKFKNKKDDLYSLSHNYVYDIYEDGKKRLWIATYGGGINLLQNDADNNYIFINHRNHLNGYPVNGCHQVRMMTSGLDNQMLVATTNGLVVFDNTFDEPENIYFNHYSYTPSDSTCLSNNDVHDVLVTSEHEIFIATFGGGLNKMLADQSANFEYKFKSFTVDDGLPSDVLLALQEDDKGDLWISTENGLTCFSPGKKTFSNFDQTSYLKQIIFSEASDAKLSDGTLCFGSNNGVLLYHPDSVSKSNFVPKLAFSEFRLFNRKLDVGEDGILPKHVDAVDEVTLKHNQNIFSVSFAAMDMRYPEAVRYAVKLEGLDPGWKYIDNQRVASYTNLSHGEYKLRIRSTNSDGVWVDNERTLNITILPSFWETNQAYALYVIVFLLFISGSVYILYTIYRLRHKVEMEHQLSELKLNFFTSISHELRTPLTLISGPLEEALKMEESNSRTRRQLQIVKKNSDRMLRLINQIMDFVKIRNERMTLTVRKISPASFVSGVMDHFRFVAMDKHVDFQLFDYSGGECLWADSDKLEKIMYNLLSNAFKYLGDGEFVYVTIENNEKEMKIVVSDDGVGIKDHQKNKLYNRFNSFLDKTMSDKPSTGIGLSVVKDFVDMHGGKIHVENKHERGSSFVVTFKKGLNHFGPEVKIYEDDFIENPVKVEDDVVLEDEKLNAEEEDALVTESENTLLLVEDDQEVRSFVKGILIEKFNVIEAVNGKQGVEKALEFLPDLIISDLMMPEMDGVEFLAIVRKELKTSHIPFIILSAKDNLQSRLEGLEKGADAYISKPFSTSYLLTRIENLLNQRKRLHLLLQGNSTKNFGLEPDMPEFTSLDETFLASLKQFMEDNMDNGELVVEDLVGAMNVSRSVFFKKLKTLTGLAPIEFIKDMRMKRAAQLIEKEQFNMTQISYMVGINDPRYFSKCFKQKYGVSPSKYKSSEHAENKSGIGL